MVELEDQYLKKIPDLTWFLIRTMPRSERNAELFLKAQGFPCYLPRCSKVYVNSFTGKNGKTYSYRRPPVLSSMFPGYIFAALDSDGIGRTRACRYIAQVCPHTNYDEDELLRDLRKVQEFEYLALHNQVEIKPELAEGMEVCIMRGPLKGWEGVVEKRIDRNFVFVRLTSIGYSIGIQCAAADCEMLN